MSKVSKYIGDLLVNSGLRYNRAYMTPPEVNKINGYILPEPCLLGVEFEWEGTGQNYLGIMGKYPALQEYWLATRDGSLRGEDAVEFKTNGPLAPDDLFPALEAMMEASVKWQASRRTGLHVHMNAGDLTFRQLSNFVTLYALFEPCIYHAAGDERGANPFTVPLYKDGWVTGRIAAAFEHSDNLIAVLRESINKYCGLNLASLFTYGTVEFRHLRTTHDKEKIYAWINMILLLRRFSMREDFERVFIRYVEQRNYRGLLDEVYMGARVWEDLLYPDMYEEIEFLGLDLAYEFFFSREVIKKEKKGKKKVGPVFRIPDPAPRAGVGVNPLRFIQENQFLFDQQLDRLIIDDPINQVNNGR